MVGHELKGLLLNYALETRQKEEVTSANEKMTMVDQNLASIEKEYIATDYGLESEPVSRRVIIHTQSVYNEFVSTGIMLSTTSFI
jgi:hypothetical protein